MEIFRGTRFEHSYAAAPRQVQRAFDKRFYFLIQNDVYYIVDVIPHPE